LVFDAAQFVFERLGADQRPRAQIASPGKVADAMTRLAAADDAVSAFNRISGRSTPFLSYLEICKTATHLEGKTFDQACSQINKFAVGRWCTRQTQGALAPNPSRYAMSGVAADGIRASSCQHPVQHHHADGSLSVLGRETAGSHSRSDQH
jgi:hypothetical protein